MKIAITVRGEGMNAPVDPRVGRAQGFLIYDIDTGETSFIDNSAGVNAAGGAGVQAAQAIARAGAEALVTGHCGPNAYRVLQEAGVAVYMGASGTATEAIQAFKEGKLTTTDSPDVEGHWQ